jgi:hypothetical protein
MMVRTNRLQREALLRVFSRNDPKPEHPVNVKAWWLRYREFRATVHGGSGCIMVQWRGMWLGIEPDGYTHS